MYGKIMTLVLDVILLNNMYLHVWYDSFIKYSDNAVTYPDYECQGRIAI